MGIEQIASVSRNDHVRWPDVGVYPALSMYTKLFVSICRAMNGLCESYLKVAQGPRDAGVLHISTHKEDYRGDIRLQLL